MRSAFLTFVLTLPAHGWSPLSTYGSLSRISVPRIATQLPAEYDASKIRNVAIIAHVDHGKTTLVDAMLKDSNVYRENEEVKERVMDSDDQERERGITILAKNVAIDYKDHKINIVDTPGHADFGGEVERIMNMVGGVLLVVDSVEGPKPQTRFVLKKALERGLKAVLVINKIDRPSARPDYVVDKTFDLFCELNASDEQTDFPIVYTSAILGMSGHEPDTLEKSMSSIFDTILELPAQNADVEKPLQLLIANIDYDEFKGKLGIGRISAGSLKVGDQVGFMQPDGEMKKSKVTELFVFEKLGRSNVDEAKAGEIVMVAGLADIMIGDTVVNPQDPVPLPPIAVEEPTVRMTFGVNKSPLAGKEGKKLTSRMIRDRLMKELDRNVALRVESSEKSADTYIVSGRGQLHLTVLIETMRREGFELMVGAPSVIAKEVDGVKCEPFEAVECNVPEEYVGACVDLLARRKGELQDMIASPSEGTTMLKYLVPTRGLLGLRNAMLTATRGTALVDSVFDSYKPWAGDLETREKGSLLAFETGVVTPHGVTGAQDRGQLFIPPKVEVYENMIIGIHQRPGDLKVNVCKVKALTNMRSATKGITEGISPPIDMSLDACVEYIMDDECVEVTPTMTRMTKVPGWKRPKK